MLLCVPGVRGCVLLYQCVRQWTIAVLSVDRLSPFQARRLTDRSSIALTSVVQRFSERVALSDCTDRLTYGELARLVYRIAAAVSDSVADRSGPVAIMLSRDVSFPAAMLGALASGRGFVPLDAGDPPERIRHVAAQSGAAAVISAGELASQSRYGRSTTCSVRSAARPSESVARRPMSPLPLGGAIKKRGY